MSSCAHIIVRFKCLPLALFKRSHSLFILSSKSVKYFYKIQYFINWQTVCVTYGHHNCQSSPLYHRPDKNMVHIRKQTETGLLLCISLDCIDSQLGKLFTLHFFNLAQNIVHCHLTKKEFAEFNLEIMLFK